MGDGPSGPLTPRTPLVHEALACLLTSRAQTNSPCCFCWCYYDGGKKRACSKRWSSWRQARLFTVRGQVRGPKGRGNVAYSEHRFESHTERAPCCVTLSKLLNLSASQFPGNEVEIIAPTSLGCCEIKLENTHKFRTFLHPAYRPSVDWYY